MKKIRVFVVVDFETSRAIRAYESEEKANDFADDLLLKEKRDTLVTEVTAYLDD